MEDMEDIVAVMHCFGSSATTEGATAVYLSQDNDSSWSIRLHALTSVLFMFRMAVDLSSMTF